MPRAQAVNPYGAPAAAPGMGMGAAMERGVQIDPNRKLAQGDQLSFRIEEDQAEPIPVVVSSAGMVQVEPLPQAVKVSGMTTEEAEAEIKRQLEKEYYHRATVHLNLLQANLAATMGFVYLDGLVARVGGMPIQQERPMMLSEAISMAGGFAKFADDRRVRVTRPARGGGSSQQFVVDVKAIVQEGKTQLDMQLQPGDRIYVKQRAFQF